MHSTEALMLLLFFASMAAGMLGALVGLGGGVLIVPLLTIGFNLDIRLAIGASIVCVIATSSGAGAALLRDRMTNFRIGTFLEVATTVGAISGALIAPHLPVRALSILFGLILLATVAPTFKKIGGEATLPTVSDPIALRLKLGSAYPDRRLGRDVTYSVTGSPLGFGLMYIAGVVSGLLGIGSGALKVLAMDTAMRLPIKVSTATSNYMIGVTAAASAGIYFWRGDVLPLVAAPVALGVLSGALFGAHFLIRFRSSTVRLVFLVALTLVAVQMLLRGVGVL
jgi:uncharacterized membrane protein YfcA